MHSADRLFSIFEYLASCFSGKFIVMCDSLNTADVQLYR